MHPSSAVPAPHVSQRQGRGDRQIRVGGLLASADARRCRPGRNCLRREPDGQAAAGAQAGIVLGPVGHPVPLLGDVMAPSGIRFERREECPYMVKGSRPGLILPKAAQAGDQCNKVKHYC